jgi:hypothetical protein
MLSPRSLAAVDMWGATGTARRRRLVCAEFVLAAVGCGLLGARMATAATGSYRILGLWLVAVGLNYEPLAFHALLLLRSGRLERECLALDLERGVRTGAARSQFLILVPLAVVAAEVAGWIRTRT